MTKTVRTEDRSSDTLEGPAWLWIVAVIAAVVCLTASASAQTYPTKPVRYILPATGASEIVGRLIAQGLTEQLGHQVFVDVRPGAGSNIGASWAPRRQRTATRSCNSCSRTP